MSGKTQEHSNITEPIITEVDLINAYRKTKVDLYYSSRQNFRSLLEYEQDLKGNLEKLLNVVNEATSIPYFKIDSNSYSLMGKSVEKKNDSTNDYDVTFRLIENFSIDFHILSSLWIQKIGEKIDAEFDDNIVYGNRLRRREDGVLSQNSLGNFKPYSRQYGTWQNKAINAINVSLKAGNAVSIFTTDVTAFYHTIPLEVLQSVEMNEYVEIEYKSLHNLFTNCLFEWRDKVEGSLFNHGDSEENVGKHIGIPVGLSASSIIANWVMKPLDDEILERLTPVYYGRYVDDILLVLPNIGNYKQQENMIHWLESQLDCLKLTKDNDNKLHYYFTYNTNNSYVSFPLNESKSNVIELESEFGSVELEVFIRQRNENTSEWRALPELPIDSKRVKTRLLEIQKNDNLKSLALRSFEKVSKNQMKFVFTLRDFEACLRIFPPSAWKAQREAFLEMFAKYFVTFEQFFEYEKYFYRVLTLGIMGKDYKALAKILYAFSEMMNKLNTKGDLHITGPVDKKPSCNKECLFNKYHENVLENIENLIERSCSGFDYSLLTVEFKRLVGKKDNDVVQKINIWMNGFKEQKPISNEDEELSSYHAHDLAIFPYKYQSFPLYLNPLYLYNKKIVQKPLTGEERTKIIDFYEGKKFQNLNESLTQLYPYWFPTRPYNSNDLSFIEVDATPPKEKGWDGNEIFELLKYLRGFRFRSELNRIRYTPARTTANDYFPYPMLEIPNGYQKKRIPVALACWKMNESELRDHILDTNDDSKQVAHYYRFGMLINQILSSPIPIKYVVFPELALPPRWFHTAAMKLQTKNIVLISGIRYIFESNKEGNTERIKPKTVSNEVWASLDYNLFGFPNHFIYRQQKQTPAHEEKRLLQELAGLSLTPSKPADERMWPPIIRHGNFFFSLLVCSEMLNVSVRSNLAGKVDALFAVEWNKDINTFNSLVESSAMDLHAYIVQCNNNQYGDCRIRAPYKNDFERDVVKSKGGENDYFMIGKIDIQSLREYQLTEHPGTGSEAKFKPFPIGFKMSEERRDNWKKIKRNRQSETENSIQ